MLSGVRESCALLRAAVRAARAAVSVRRRARSAAWRQLALAGLRSAHARVQTHAPGAAACRRAPRPSGACLRPKACSFKPTIRRFKKSQKKKSLKTKNGFFFSGGETNP